MRLFEANEEEGVVGVSCPVHGDVARKAACDGECHVRELSSDLKICIARQMDQGQHFRLHWIDLGSLRLTITQLERSHTFLPCRAIWASGFVGIVLRPGAGESLTLGGGEERVGEEYEGAGGQASTARHSEDDAGIEGGEGVSLTRGASGPAT